MRLRRRRPRRSSRLNAILLRRTVLGSFGRLPRLEHRGNFGDARLADLAFHADDLDELAQGARHARGEFRLRVEHRRDGFDRPPLIEQQREELIPHHCLEGCERKLASGLLAHALKQPKPTFIGDAVRDADIEKGADGRFARTALRNVPCELFDPVSDEGADTRHRRQGGDAETHPRP